MESQRLNRLHTGAWHPTHPVWIGCVLAIGIWTGLLSAGLWFYIDPPIRVHDEFSYRLAADTLLHGRLSNPTPPAWEALQSIHVVMQPSYASKYPLGFGIAVAIGWIVLGTPHAGSWLCAALLTMSCTWMLAGALPRRWALLGGLILSLHPFMQIGWAESLMNGLLPASGSAFLTGALLRLRRRTNFHHAMIAGFGIAILALTRPFEGLCCTVLCGVLFVMWCRASTWKDCLRRVVAIAIPMSAPIAAALIMIFAQNIAVTGNWRQMAYQLHEQQYGVAPLFVFNSPRMENAHPRMDLPDVVRRYHAVECLNWYRDRMGFKGWLRGIKDGIAAIALLCFPMVLLLLAAGRRWMGLRLPLTLVMVCLLQLAASASVCWVYPHYLAPLLPWLVLIIMIAIRVSHLQRSLDRRFLVRFAVLALVVIQIVSLTTASRVAKEKLGESWAKKRQQIERSLIAAGGKHLVFVEYSENHNVHHEWVYNDADPMTSSIVWARSEHGRWSKEVLSSYGEGRKVWSIEADTGTGLRLEAGDLSKESSCRAPQADL